MEMALGVPEVVRMARAMGAPPWYPRFEATGTVKYVSDNPEDQFGPSLTLGGYGETPLQLATAASVLASGGTLRQPQVVRSARTASGGEALNRGASGGSRAIDAGTAFIVSQMLADDANRAMMYGRGSPLALPGRRAAALVGTTDNYTDAWAVGYTPSLVTAVWVGNPDSGPMLTGSDGVFVAAPAWNHFMQAALDRMGTGDEWFTPPAGVQEAQVNGRPAWFLEGTSASTPPPPLPDTVRLSSA